MNFCIVVEFLVVISLVLYFFFIFVYSFFLQTALDELCSILPWRRIQMMYRNILFSLTILFYFIFFFLIIYVNMVLVHFHNSIIKCIERQSEDLPKLQTAIQSPYRTTTINQISKLTPKVLVPTRSTNVTLSPILMHLTLPFTLNTFIFQNLVHWKSATELVNRPMSWGIVEGMDLVKISGHAISTVRKI